MRSPEGREKDEIKKYLKSIGAWHFSPTTMGFGKSGTPDIVGVITSAEFGYGRFFAIEVKREGKKPTPLQIERIRQIRDMGGIAEWGTAERVIDKFENYKRMR